MQHVAQSRWGKDHWSVLAYVETCCVDARGATGRLDLRRLRTNEGTHPLLAVNHSSVGAWQAAWGTRLAGFFDSRDPSLQLADHDDWDCLYDLEAEGLIEILSTVNGVVQITEKGLEICGKLRAHKARGGMFATFGLLAA